MALSCSASVALAITLAVVPDGCDPTVPGFPRSGPTSDPDILHAAEWRDLDDLETLRWAAGASEARQLWRLYPDSGSSISVLSGGAPAVDVPVELRDAAAQVLARTRTDVHGVGELRAAVNDDHPLFPLSVLVGEGRGAKLIELGDDTPDPLVVQVDAIPPPAILDLAFVVDTTEQMGATLAFLQSELGEVIGRVRAQAPADLELRISVGFYRDRAEGYVVRSFPFTTDVEAALADLAAQRTSTGSGDRDAVVRALEDMIEAHDWSPRATGRLLFFFLDESPRETNANRDALEVITTGAAEQGIRLIPIGAAHIDEHTEFLARLLDVATGGTYVFLVDPGEREGPAFHPSFGIVDVERLEDLLVRLIDEAIAVE